MYFKIFPILTKIFFNVCFVHFLIFTQLEKTWAKQFSYIFRITSVCFMIKALWPLILAPNIWKIKSYPKPFRTRTNAMV